MNDLLVNWLMELSPKYAPFYDLYCFLIQTTIYISITALFIIAFKLIFKNRLKARWHFLIWAILLIRLLIPNLPTSSFSVFNTAKVDEQFVSRTSYYFVEEKPSEDKYTVAEGLQKMIEGDKGAYSELETYDGGARGYTINIDRIVIFTWLGGAVLLACYFVTVLSFYRHKLKKRRVDCGENELSILKLCREKLNIKREVRLYRADTTPMLIGIFKPAIYIPDSLSDNELEATFLHELSHMKHFDILWTAVATAVLCMNWFNPIIWISFFMFKRDVEVYCDERTLQYADNKQSYALLLLKTATARKEKFVLGTTSLQSGKADVKRRIRYMAKFKKPTVATLLIAGMLFAFVSTGCLTNALNTKPTAVICNTANGCKMDIVLDARYSDYGARDYDTLGFMQFETDMSISEIADIMLLDNAKTLGISYEDENQVLLSTLTEERNREFPFLLLTKRASDSNGKDVENMVFLECLCYNHYYVDRSGNDDYRFYFPKHLAKEYEYYNCDNENGFHNVNVYNPFFEDVELIQKDNIVDLIEDFYRDIYLYTTVKNYKDRSEILITTEAREPLFKVYYNKSKNSVSYKAYSALFGESAKSVIYKLKNAADRQDDDTLRSCFDNVPDSELEKVKIAKNMTFENIRCEVCDNVNRKYYFTTFAQMDGLTYNKYFTVEYFGGEPRITDTNLAENASYAEDFTKPSTESARRIFINEKLGEPDLSEFKKTAFSGVPDVIYADNKKAIVSGDCGVLEYSFVEEKVTLFVPYRYMQKLGVSLPYGYASEDGTKVIIQDQAQSIAGNQSVNANYTSLVIDLEERTIYDHPIPNRLLLFNYFSISDLSKSKQEEYGIDENYSGYGYVYYNEDTVVYAQMKPDWSPENLRIVRYKVYYNKTDEFKIIN